MPGRAPGPLDRAAARPASPLTGPPAAAARTSRRVAGPRSAPGREHDDAGRGEAGQPLLALGEHEAQRELPRGRGAASGTRSARQAVDAEHRAPVPLQGQREPGDVVVEERGEDDGERPRRDLGEQARRQRARGRSGLDAPAGQHGAVPRGPGRGQRGPQALELALPPRRDAPRPWGP